MKVNWQKEAINDLKVYNARKVSIISMSEKIKELEAKAERLGSASSNVPVQGGSSKGEDVRINCIIECDRLKTNIRTVRHWLGSVEKGLNTLTEDERKVLDGFYINKTTRHIDKLCDTLHCEKSTVYRLKDSALYKFTIAMYGLVDL